MVIYSFLACSYALFGNDSTLTNRWAIRPKTGSCKAIISLTFTSAGSRYYPKLIPITQGRIYAGALDIINRTVAEEQGA